MLTLDLKVQRALEEAMADVPRGAAVVLDPRDGGILAMVSRPVYDPNEFSHGLSRARWKELSEGGANPLLDRAIQGVYPPGSTFKIVTMSAALSRGVARPDTRLAPCAGGLNYGGRRFGCWEHRGHGSLDLIEALQHSCDVYFYQLGLQARARRPRGRRRGPWAWGRAPAWTCRRRPAGLIPSAEPTTTGAGGPGAGARGCCSTSPSGRASCC